MSYAAATSAYRDMEVLSAPPGRLVVIVYDHLLVNLRRTAIAIDTRNVELFSSSLGKSQDALAELMGDLDLERGGTIGRELASLYTFFLASLVDVARTKDQRLLARISAQLSELRDAFAQVAATAPATTTATAA